MDEMIALTFKSEEDALAATERLVAAGICDVALRPPAESTWVLSIHASGAHDKARLREFACQSARLTNTWRSMMAQYVPMAVAAATTFHRVHRTTRAIRDRRDFDDALSWSKTAAFDQRGDRRALVRPARRYAPRNLPDRARGTAV